MAVEGAGMGRGGGRRRRYAGRDLTQGSIPRNLWSLAWPQTIEGVMRVVDQMADLIWAGMLGTRSIAGVGVAQQYTQMVWTGRQGIDTSMRAMVARAIGRGDVALANHVVWQAATLTAIFFLVITAIGVFLTEPMLRLLGVSDAVMAQAAPYMRVQFMGQGVLGFQMLSGHALAASGDTMTPMKATVVSRVIHMGLSPFLVFGLLGFPEFGISGAALASMIANAFGLGLNIWALHTGTSRLHLRISEYRLDFKLLREQLKIGLPAAVTGAERSIAQLLLVAIVTRFGDTALAAYTLTRRVEMFANLGSQGLGQAAGIIVGQSLGAQQPERAKRTVYWAIGYVLTIKSLLGSFLFFFPFVILSLFTRDPDFIDVASVWVKIQVWSHVAMGVSQVLMQTFQTAGDTLFPMLVTLVTIWGVQQPLAYWLADTSLGQYGVAWAISIALASRLLFYVPYFYWGRWMRVRMMENRHGLGPPPEAAPAAAGAAASEALAPARVDA
jgi:putative MATE family efflux protein